MNILEVNCTDIKGHLFNGYDLMMELNKDDNFNIHQVVLRRISKSPYVVADLENLLLEQFLTKLEIMYSITNTLSPNGSKLNKIKEFKEADIVHFHILHNAFISLLDYPKLFSQHKSIWTIHDPWIMTGNCLHPLKCEQWKSGCKHCTGKGVMLYAMQDNNVEFMWKLKEHVLKMLNPHVVVSSMYMKQFLLKSPIANHFDKISVIPFGVDISKYNILRKNQAKKKFGLNEDVTIGFRNEGEKIKGSKYAVEALRNLNNVSHYNILTVGNGTIGDKKPLHATVLELGWINSESTMIDFYEACDIFIMPSLAESFGIMAIEAMAAGCVVICFRGTAVEVMTDSPRCGVAAEHCSAESLTRELSLLLEKPEDMKCRGKKGRELVEKRYRFEHYIEHHRNLYENVFFGN